MKKAEQSSLLVNFIKSPWKSKSSLCIFDLLLTQKNVLRDSVLLMWLRHRKSSLSLTLPPNLDILQGALSSWRRCLRQNCLPSVLQSLNLKNQCCHSTHFGSWEQWQIHYAGLKVEVHFHRMCLFFMVVGQRARRLFAWSPAKALVPEHFALQMHHYPATLKRKKVGLLLSLL